MQANPFDQFDGPIMGPPPVVDPYKQAAEQRAQAAAERAEEDQQFQREKFAWDKEKQAQDRAAGVGVDGKTTEGEKKAASFLIRALGANESYEGTGVGPRSLPGQVMADTAPNLLNVLPGAIGNSPERQVADSAQDEFIAASLRQDSGAAIPEEELERQRRIYFPMPGDSEQAIEQKRQARLRALEGLRQSSGALEKSAEDRYRAMVGPLVNQGGQVAGGTHNNGDDQAALGIATGDTRREDDPALAGVRDEYIRRLGDGQNASQLVSWARSVGITDPAAFRSIAEQVKFRDANPGVAMSEYDTSELDDRIVALSAREKGAAQLADDPVGAFVASAADALTGFNLDSLSGVTGGNSELARLALGEIGERNPVSSMAGTLAGGTAAALGGEAMLAGKIATPALRALVADGAYGAAAGAGMSDYAADGSQASAADRLAGAGTGTLAGLVGSYAGNKIGQGAKNFARGVQDPNVQTLQQAGIPLTVGQQVGNSGRAGAMVKGVEDRLSGLPVVGDTVQARRMEGFRSFNSKAFDRALEPIEGSVGDAVGEDAIERAQTLVSEAYGKALEGKAVMPDEAFSRDMTNALTRAGKLPRVGEEIMDQIVEILRPYDGEAALTGEAMQTISQELQQLKRSYRNDPMKKRVGDVVGAAEQSIFGMFERQAPEVMPAYNKAKTAYRRLSILEDAVLKGKNQQGVFTPAQLGAADVANTKKYDGKGAAARGDRPFMDLQRAAQDVLPNKVPDSGTAGRVVVPAVAAGQAPLSALTLGGILAAAYTKAGQRLLTKPGRGMNGKTGKLLKDDRTRRAIQAGAGAGAVSLSSQ